MNLVIVAAARNISIVMGNSKPITFFLNFLFCLMLPSLSSCQKKENSSHQTGDFKQRLLYSLPFKARSAPITNSLKSPLALPQNRLSKGSYSFYGNHFVYIHPTTQALIFYDGNHNSLYETFPSNQVIHIALFDSKLFGLVHQAESNAFSVFEFSLPSGKIHSYESFASPSTDRTPSDFQMVKRLGEPSLILLWGHSHVLEMEPDQPIRTYPLNPSEVHSKETVLKEVALAEEKNLCFLVHRLYKQGIYIGTLLRAYDYKQQKLRHEKTLTSPGEHFFGFYHHRDVVMLKAFTNAHVLEFISYSYPDYENSSKRIFPLQAVYPIDFSYRGDVLFGYTQTKEHLNFYTWK